MNTNKKIILVAGSFVVGAATGFGVGYIVFKSKYERIAEEEIQSVREAYGKNSIPKPDLATFVEMPPPTNVDVVEPTPQQFVQNLIDDEGYASADQETDVDTFRRFFGRVPTNQELVEIGEEGSLSAWMTRTKTDSTRSGIDVDIPDPEDLGEEIPEVPPRSPDRPYVISVQEWHENDLSYEQITLTYWADDDVLADDGGKEVRKREEIVGEANLHRFGFLSEDADIVYVRNETMKADYEVTKDERSWSEVVRGVKTGEDDGRPHRMRSNDE
jgi:hypothetical protein